MIKKYKVIAIPPGETIKEQISAKGITQKEFAQRMGYSEKHISQMLNGYAKLTQETALRLENVLGIPANFWNKLEAIFQEDLTRIKNIIRMEKEQEVAKEIPYNEMSKYGWVEKSRKSEERIQYLRRFFKVGSLEFIERVNIYSISFRILDDGKASKYALLAWLQRGWNEASEMETKDFDIKKLNDSIDDLRKLVKLNSEIFLPKMREICSDCGVAVVLVPHLPKTYAHGAASWINSNKAVIQLTIRGKTSDRFWFSFFHELAHILKHSKKDIYISYNIDEGDDKSNPEKEADKIAGNILIPEKDFRTFIINQEINRETIIKFAEETDIHPGIVVGRLQFDEYIPYSHFNDLKKKYEWVDERYRN
jgi:HTH-type transcriptional regulator/antitoxin HigA